jgi:hypothetical protein
VLDEILQERVSSSRNRVNFRGVKRKMSNYNLRPRKRQRTRRINFTARIRIIKLRKQTRMCSLSEQYWP